MNAVEIEQAISDLAAQPFDRAEFPYAFLEAFGNKATTLKKLRTGNSNGSDVPGGVLQRSNIHIATCDAGAVDDTLTALRQSPKTSAAKAKFILATDGEQFQARRSPAPMPNSPITSVYSCRWRASPPSSRSARAPLTSGRRAGSTSSMSNC